MKKLLGIVCVFLMIALFLLPVGASAKGITDEVDGLKVNLQTEKKDYEEGEEINFSLTFSNSTKRDMQNVRVELILPEGLSPSRGTPVHNRVDVDKLGEYVYSGAITPVGDGIAALDMDTSDATKDTNVGAIIGYILLGVLAAGIAVAVVIIIKRPERRLRIISIILASLMLIGTVPVGIIAFSGRDIIMYLEESVYINGEKAEFGVKITKLRDKHSQDISLDLGSAMYDTVENIYYVFDEVTTLNGCLFNERYSKKIELTVHDCNDKLLFEAEISPKTDFAVEKFGLIVGLNTVKFKVTQQDGFVYEEKLVINNLCEENMKHLDVDRGDDDDDGVLNFTEELYHTDKNNPDTDGDRLSDYVEMAQVGTDPLKPDTDGNGVTDAEEDSDGDGISNIVEVTEHNTNPGLSDTDLDGLSDGEEVTDIKTDPLKTDTDDDGKDDRWELDKGYDPTLPNADFPKFECESEVPEIEIKSDGEARVEKVEGDLNFFDGMPGSVGVPPFEITLDKGSEAEIYIDVEPEYSDEDIGGYIYDEGTQLYSRVPIEWVDEDIVKMSATKSGKYILLNNRLVSDVWENDIFRPSENTDGNIDIVFVIDRSASMDSNDPDRNRIEVTKKFIEKLRSGKDRAAAVQFSAIGEELVPLTENKEILIKAINGIQNSDGGGCSGADDNAGTNGAAGLRAALNQLNGSTARYKYIILLTDGKDTHNDEPYGNLAGTEGITGEARSKGIVIHTVGLVGTGEVDTDLLRLVATATRGNYYQISVSEDGAENESEFIKIYDEIESVTVDRQIDSNNDGISDYYTRLITEGNITTTSGLRFLFGSASYDEVQANADFDGDGIINGDELKIAESTDGVYVMLISYPHLVDSDGDGISDPDEKKIQMNPVKYNAAAEKDDLDWLLSDDNFTAHGYLERYNGSEFIQDSVLIGNAFFGSVLDQTKIYRAILVKYFEAIDSEIADTHRSQAYAEFAMAYLNTVTDTMGDQLKERVRDGDVAGFIEGIDKLDDFFSDLLDTIKIGANYDVVEEIIKKAVNLASADELACIAEVDKYINFYKDVLKNWPDVMPGGDSKAWNELLNAIDDAILKLDDLKTGLQNGIDLKVTKIGDIVENVGFVLTVGMDMWDNYLNYCDAVAALNTIRDNCYVLDCILGSSADNCYLYVAAYELKTALMKENGEDSEYLSNLIITDTLDKVLAEGILLIVGNAGVPGKVLMAVQMVGNLFFDLDDVSRQAAETVALSQTAAILSKNFRARIAAGSAELVDGKYVFGRNVSKDSLCYLVNLALLRRETENVYKNWQSSISVSNTANENVGKCNDLIEKYDKKYEDFILKYI